MKRPYNIADIIPLQYEVPTLSREGQPIDTYDAPNPSPYEVANSMEAEQKIYETPCDIEESVGPVYHEPSSDEQKIYEEFEGKRFRKLFHKEITYVKYYFDSISSKV